MRVTVVRAARGIASAPVMQLVAVSTIAVAVFVLGVVLAIGVNLDAVVERFGARAQIVAFLADAADDAALNAAATTARGWPEVESVRAVDRAAALADLRAALGSDATALEGVDPTVLPGVLEVTLRSGVDAAARDAVLGRLKALPALGEAGALDDGRDVLARLARVRDALRLAGAVVAGLVLLAMIFIVSNTIRLTLFARRDELEIMRLIGATDAFIRGPCYLEGAFQGALGALLAVALLFALHGALPADTLADVDLLPRPLRFLGAGALTALVLGSTAVGVLASHLAAGRFLRGQDEG
ncbi:MAG: permease-like cell division protein FtsX [Myxococcales bacterium]|nr:permease-like cell division protein FtsX [Myxococcales bacterium]